MLRPLELNSGLFDGILSQCCSEESPKSDFSDQCIFQIFEQDLNDADIKSMVRHEEPSFYKMSASNNCECY